MNNTADFQRIKEKTIDEIGEIEQWDIVFLKQINIMIRTHKVVKYVKRKNKSNLPAIAR